MLEIVYLEKFKEVLEISKMLKNSFYLPMLPDCNIGKMHFFNILPKDKINTLVNPKHESKIKQK